jgi:hypothetical protein
VRGARGGCGGVGVRVRGEGGGLDGSVQEVIENTALLGEVLRQQAS